MRRALPVFTLFLAIGIALPPGAKRRVRRLLGALLFFHLRLRSRPLVLDPGPLLVVSPHPDDATLGCGGLLFQKRLAGHPVHILYLTDGSASHPHHPTLTPSALADLRHREARLAKRRLGVDSACLRFINLPDGCLSLLDPVTRETVVSTLADQLSSLHPATLLLPCRHDGSDEHEAAFRLVAAALDRAALRPRLLEFPVWSAWNPLLLVRPLFRARRIHRFEFPGYGPHKQHALSAYASQLLPSPPWNDAVLSADFVRAFSRETELFFEYVP